MTLRMWFPERPLSSVGNVAIDAARIHALRADAVAMYLEQPDEMPALPEEIAEARKTALPSITVGDRLQ